MHMFFFSFNFFIFRLQQFVDASGNKPSYLGEFLGFFLLQEFFYFVHSFATAKHGVVWCFPFFFQVFFMI